MGIGLEFASKFLGNDLTLGTEERLKNGRLATSPKDNYLITCINFDDY